MFYNEATEDHKKTLLAELDGMNLESNEIFSQLKNLFDSNLTDNLEKKLSMLTPLVIYKICMNHPFLKALCENENSIHTKTWAALLKEMSYQGDKIISIDREEVTTLSQYLGAYFLTQSHLLENSSPQLSSIYLDKSCDYGMFHALQNRIAYNEIKIKNNSATADEKTIFFKDVSRICNLYWGIGYMHAAWTLINIGNYIANKGEVDNLNQSQLYHETAAIHFLWAKELSSYKNLSRNTDAVKVICGEEGLKIFGFDDLVSANAYIFKHVNNTITPHVDLRNSVRSKVYNLIRPNNIKK